MSPMHFCVTEQVKREREKRGCMVRTCVCRVGACEKRERERTRRLEIVEMSRLKIEGTFSLALSLGNFNTPRAFH